MKIVKRSITIAVVAVAAVLMLGPALRDYVILHINGWLSPHVAAARPVTWASGTAAPSSEHRPNIIVILADDLGFNDLSFAGGGVADGAVPTPNIDSIAHDGVNFTQAYAGDATCAPSRAAILTGRYATRFGFEFTPVPKEFAKVIARFKADQSDLPAIYRADREKDAIPLDDMGIPKTEITIAALLKKQGYHTIHLGKWHVGSSPQYRPLSVGFDESLGFYQGASMYLPEDSPDVVNSKQQFDPVDKFIWANLPYAVNLNEEAYFHPTGYLTDYLADQAVAAIHANASRPFFLYLAFNAPHTPLQALKSDFDALPQIKDRRLRVYAAMIRALDRDVGKVLASLKREGLDDNTLVIFTSDNGGANYLGLPDINKPFRGWKATFFEGGIHVPFFIRWPAQLSHGATYAEPVAHVDIFSTAAAVSGAPLPSDRTVDGVDLIPYLKGEKSDGPHKTLYWRSGGYSTLLDGEWKLQITEQPNKYWLFNLKTDPTEKINLAQRNPEKVSELKTLITQEDKEMSKSLWPSLLEAPIHIDKPLGVPYSAEDEYIYWSN